MRSRGQGEDELHEAVELDRFNATIRSGAPLPRGAFARSGLQRRFGGSGGGRRFARDPHGGRPPDGSDLVSLPTTSLVAWYEPRDASNTVTTGRFDAFADLSGSGNTLATISSGTSRPGQVTAAGYNNQIVGDWAGTVVGMRKVTFAGGPLSSPFTIVAYAHLTANNQTLFGAGGATNRAFSYGVAGAITLRSNAGANLDTTLAPSTPTKIVIVFNGLASAVYLDSMTTPVATGDTGGGNFDGLSLGCLYTNGLANRGQYAFFAIYNSALAQATRTQVGAYLTQEFG